jgi:aryl-alcohol dehydrogenase-like predicted oxidoreductase
MAIEKRRLGRSGPEITVVGSGSWAIGGGDGLFGWGAQDDAQSIEAIHRAVAHGINWIDTAAAYGLGHSEEVVGRAIRNLSSGDQLLVFTKCGLPWDEADPMAPTVRDLSPKRIRLECEASLSRLGVEAIDLYQFHWPDEIGTAVEDSWGEMSRLVAEGKVRHAGVSNFDVGLLELCEPIMHVDSLQPPFSAIRRDAAADLIPWCREHGTGVICYSPMQAGLLTDSFSASRVAEMDAGDWRRQNELFVEPALSRHLALRDALVPIADRHDTTVAAVAVAWVIAWPGVTGAIVGARSAAQVDGWIAAASIDLTPEDLAEVVAAIDRTGAGSGPAQLAPREMSSREARP